MRPPLRREGVCRETRGLGQQTLAVIAKENPTEWREQKNAFLRWPARRVRVRQFLNGASLAQRRSRLSRAWLGLHHSQHVGGRGSGRLLLRGVLQSTGAFLAWLCGARV